MPAKSEAAKEKKRQRDREREKTRAPRDRTNDKKRDRREEYKRRRESEEYKEKEREREKNRVRNYRKKHIDGPDPWGGPDPWEENNWTNLYIAKRDNNEAYRPLLDMLHKSDRQKGVIRELVYETTALPVDVRRGVPRVWQTNRGATLQFPGSPLIKIFKVNNPREQHPIPIGEGELIRRYFSQFRNGKKNLFPRCKYNHVIDAPVYFNPEGPIDLLEWDVEYVDISRCYSQLLEHLPSLAVTFNYAARIYSAIDTLPPYDPELLKSKYFGRAAIGTLRQKKGRCFIYGEPHSFLSRYYHGDTATWAHGMLHVLASYAIRNCGCFRWHTDGGFFAKNGGYKFRRFLSSIGIDCTIVECLAVCFASLDQYEIVYWDNSVKQTRDFLTTYMTDYIFTPGEAGGSQRNNIIHNLNTDWMLGTLNGEKTRDE